MSKHKQPTIKIRNPHPGCAGYTSLRAANSLVERGIAAWRGVRIIELLPEPWIRTMKALDRTLNRQLVEEAEVDRQITAHRNGIVNWRGERPESKAFVPHIYPPGCVRN